MLGMFVGITMVMPNPLTVNQLEQGVTVTSDYILYPDRLMLLSAIWGSCLDGCSSRSFQAACSTGPTRDCHDLRCNSVIARRHGCRSCTHVVSHPAAGWVILTVYVVVVPRAIDDKIVHQMRVKAVHRVVGTVIGVAIAGAIAAVLRNPIPLVLLGIICLVIALELRVAGRPYWQYVIFLTPGVVFLTGYGLNADKFGVMRLVCTLIGVLLRWPPLNSFDGMQFRGSSVQRNVKQRTWRRLPKRKQILIFATSENRCG